MVACLREEPGSRHVSLLGVQSDSTFNHFRVNSRLSGLLPFGRIWRIAQTFKLSIPLKLAPFETNDAEEARNQLNRALKRLQMRRTKANERKKNERKWRRKKKILATKSVKFLQIGAIGPRVHFQASVTITCRLIPFE